MINLALHLHTYWCTGIWLQFLFFFDQHKVNRKYSCVYEGELHIMRNPGPTDSLGFSSASSHLTAAQLASNFKYPSLSSVAPLRILMYCNMVSKMLCDVSITPCGSFKMIFKLCSKISFLTFKRSNYCISTYHHRAIVINFNQKQTHFISPNAVYTGIWHGTGEGSGGVF